MDITPSDDQLAPGDVQVMNINQPSDKQAPRDHSSQLLQLPLMVQ